MYQEAPYQPRRAARSEAASIRLHRYHVLAWGQPSAARPPLVLVHGWMDVAASYQFMVDALSEAFLEDRLVIAPDWRGFGHTTARPATTTASPTTWVTWNSCSTTTPATARWIWWVTAWAATWP